MRHKWKPLKPIKLLIDNKKQDVTSHQICSMCGLRKGYLRYSRWYTSSLIYFKDGKILSRNTLPYKCLGHEFKEMLFTKEEFNI